MKNNHNGNLRTLSQSKAKQGEVRLTFANQLLNSKFKENEAVM